MFDSRSQPITPLAFAGLGLGLLCWAFLHQFRVYYRLRHFPGPFFARFTNLQRVFWVQTARSHEIHTQMHNRYGDFVRMGPNMISISDANLIPAVYPIRPGVPKGNFYRTLMPYSRQGSAMPLIFNTRDEALHMKLKKPIAPIFSLSNVLTFEKYVDQILDLLFTQLDQRFVGRETPFDLGEWLQFFAFEVMGTMTFSRQYGFLEKGCDGNGLLGAIWNYMKTAAPITQIPWFDLVWYKNPLAAALRPTTGMPILNIVRSAIEERQATLQKKPKPKSTGDDEAANRGDFLSRFFHVQMKDPSVPPWAVTAWTFSNVIAGSDSTAVVMKTLWYNLLTHPNSMQKLSDELAQAKSKITRPYPTWTEVASLPYLDACVNEAIRLHPPFCLPLERVVPKEGMSIGNGDAQRFLPGGTVIGMNPWVVNRHRPTFGDDADVWRPERWLVGADRYRAMEGSVLTFGAGRRVCLGKNIALLELKKLTSALVLNYETTILDAAQFQVENRWFFRQWDLQVTIKRQS
ncbi:cytochrome P450 [Dichotomopilus funicola]|uniref:Cytochrome P450 n=1 Tax=Dichotomopilus funicola TaxID=1934379 RepID=A0AAN6UVS2_9PEZI|nr:cytochrome P450 [Dichotomopilus funicola]